MQSDVLLLDRDCIVEQSEADYQERQRHLRFTHKIFPTTTLQNILNDKRIMSRVLVFQKMLRFNKTFSALLLLL